jgi:hypothetical protein
VSAGGLTCEACGYGKQSIVIYGETHLCTLCRDDLISTQLPAWAIASTAAVRSILECLAPIYASNFKATKRGKRVGQSARNLGAQADQAAEDRALR